MIEVVKWVGTICVILAAICRSLQLHGLDMALSIVGAGLWSYAAISTNDRPLLVVNMFILLVLILGILYAS
jgi:hydrogenase/urease accessory protein HupE